MKKARRFITARMLHLGCNIMDMARVTQWRDAIGEGYLTDRESRLLEQRYDKLKECVDDVRKIANHIERQAKAPK